MGIPIHTDRAMNTNQIGFKICSEFPKINSNTN